MVTVRRLVIVAVCRSRNRYPFHGGTLAASHPLLVFDRAQPGASLSPLSLMIFSLLFSLLFKVLLPALLLVAVVDVLTMSRARRIRLQRQSGATWQAIATRYGVSRSTVRRWSAA